MEIGSCSSSNNFALSERRTRSLVHKLKQVPELLEMYGNIIAEQERLLSFSCQLIIENAFLRVRLDETDRDYTRSEGFRKQFFSYIISNLCC